MQNYACSGNICEERYIFCLHRMLHVFYGMFHHKHVMFYRMCRTSNAFCCIVVPGERTVFSKTYFSFYVIFHHKHGMFYLTYTTLLLSSHINVLVKAVLRKTYREWPFPCMQYFTTNIKYFI